MWQFDDTDLAPSSTENTALSNCMLQYVYKSQLNIEASDTKI